VLTLQLTLPPSRATGIARLRYWLFEVLQVPAAAPPTSAIAPAMAHHLAGLLPYLLQLAKVPVFSVSQAITSPAETAEHGLLQLRLDWIDHFPQTLCQDLASLALKLCVWATQTPPGASAQAHLFQTIQSQVIDRWATRVPGGKSTLQVLRAAHRLGVPFLHLGGGVYQLGWGSQACRLDRSSTQHDSAYGARLSHDKAHTAALLRMGGLPAADHVVVQNPDQAVEAATALQFPVVVKPADQDRGEGVSVGITTEQALRRAFDLALAVSPGRKVLVERQVPGVCHRLFVAHGRLLYAVKRMPPGFWADGTHTIAQQLEQQLHAHAAIPPWERPPACSLDKPAQRSLAAQGYAPGDVPPAGTFVAVRPIESTEWGGVDEDVTHSVHPDNVSVALAATALLGLSVAGVDIITSDIAQPWHAHPTVINEVNFAPLLGGGDISRRHLTAYLQILLPQGGCIPVETFTGAAAASHARQRQAEHLALGRRCYYTSPHLTIDHHHQPVHLASRTTAERVKAMLLRPDVDALVVVAHTDTPT